MGEKKTRINRKTGSEWGYRYGKYRKRMRYNQEKTEGNSRSYSRRNRVERKSQINKIEKLEFCQTYKRII